MTSRTFHLVSRQLPNSYLHFFFGSCLIVLLHLLGGLHLLCDFRHGAINNNNVKTLGSSQRSEEETGVRKIFGADSSLNQTDKQTVESPQDSYDGASFLVAGGRKWTALGKAIIHQQDLSGRTKRKGVVWTMRIVALFVATLRVAQAFVPQAKLQRRSASKLFMAQGDDEKVLNKWSR